MTFLMTYAIRRGLPRLIQLTLSEREDVASANSYFD